MTNIAKHTIYHMEIVELVNSFYQIKITSGKKKCMIAFNTERKELQFPDNNHLTEDLISNVYQLRKILNNKRPDTFFPGFKLKFIFKNNADAIAFNNLTQIIVLDRRKGQYNVKSVNKDDKNIYQIFTDGCYLSKLKRGAYIALFKNLNSKLNLHYGRTNSNSSSLIELMAVIEGLKHSEHIECLRIISDSRYVIKGLTEWVFNWKLNDWHTAQGEKVKNIKYWQEFDKLTENKYIEFEWVKGHSAQYENSICDYYARMAAEKY
jgi:ribonuclease HI